ncbi:Retrovirus Pol polyprotein from transposon opus [Paragonimus heterotremus]|uniref:Retrovirus Pol polyprotein from transposon opus n=1 Tax=Paragonimus heterotremus TaxID=100268 RepID=A0A8J4WUS9_9TREM|nr:Retrovirus Pol polyprotein from transposon opus [Paragonimus heterotremus]
MTVDSTAQRIFGRYQFDTGRWSYVRILAALATHEALGLGLLVGFWFGCYKFQPLRKCMHLAPKPICDSYEKGMTWSTKKLQRVPQLVRQRTDPQRLLVSGAESFVLRKLLTPVTVPLKIYLAVILTGFLN